MEKGLGGTETGRRTGCGTQVSQYDPASRKGLDADRGGSHAERLLHLPLNSDHP